MAPNNNVYVVPDMKPSLSSPSYDGVLDISKSSENLIKVSQEQKQEKEKEEVKEPEPVVEPEPEGPPITLPV